MTENSDRSTRWAGILCTPRTSQEAAGNLFWMLSVLQLDVKLTKSNFIRDHKLTNRTAKSTQEVPVCLSLEISDTMEDCYLWQRLRLGLLVNPSVQKMSRFVFIGTSRVRLFEF